MSYNRRPMQKRGGRIKNNYSENTAIRRPNASHVNLSYAAQLRQNIGNVFSTESGASSGSAQTISDFYYNADECITDVRLVFQNCYIFNPPEIDLISMTLTLGNIFNSKLDKLPSQENDISSGTSNTNSAKKDTKSSSINNDSSSEPPPVCDMKKPLRPTTKRIKSSSNYNEAASTNASNCSISPDAKSKSKRWKVESCYDLSFEFSERVRRSIEAILPVDCVAMAIERAWNKNNFNRNWEDSLCPKSDVIEETTKQVYMIPVADRLPDMTCSQWPRDFSIGHPNKY